MNRVCVCVYVQERCVRGEGVSLSIPRCLSFCPTKESRFLSHGVGIPQSWYPTSWYPTFLSLFLCLSLLLSATWDLGFHEASDSRGRSWAMILCSHTPLTQSHHTYTCTHNMRIRTPMHMHTQTNRERQERHTQTRNTHINK